MKVDLALFEFLSYKSQANIQHNITDVLYFLRRTIKENSESCV